MDPCQISGAGDVMGEKKSCVVSLGDAQPVGCAHISNLAEIIYYWVPAVIRFSVFLEYF